MVKAVIFDCFGVLVASSYDNFFETFLSDKPEIVEQIHALDQQTVSGTLPLADFYKEVALITDIPEEKVISFMRHNPLHTDLVGYIENELKPFYQIGFLSNAADDRLDELFTKAQQDLFDDMILSFKVGLAKPNVEIFQMSAERLGVEPHECVFVDDVQRYVDGAQMAGMQAIRYTGFNRFKQEIETIL